MPVRSESCMQLCPYCHSLPYLYCGVILSSVQAYRATVRKSQATPALIVTLLPQEELLYQGLAKKRPDSLPHTHYRPQVARWVAVEGDVAEWVLSVNCNHVFWIKNETTAR